MASSIFSDKNGNMGIKLLVVAVLISIVMSVL